MKTSTTSSSTISIAKLKQKRALIQELTVVRHKKVYYPDQCKSLLKGLVETEVIRQICVDYQGHFDVATQVIVAEVLNSGDFPPLYVSLKREEALALKKFKDSHEVRLRSFIRRTLANFAKQVSIPHVSVVEAQDGSSSMPIGDMASHKEIELMEAQKALRKVCRVLGKSVSFEDLPQLMQKLKTDAQASRFSSAVA